MLVLTLTHVLHQAVLGLQIISQLTCSHTLESISKSLPAGIDSSGQPSLEHLLEPACGVREINRDPVQCPSPHSELEPQGIPLCTRNQKLLLHPVDVQFLQPSQSEVSHVLSIPIPPWISMVDAFLFYFLQTLSATALRPRYTSTDTRDHFCVSRPLHNAYVTTGLPQELHQDHLFLYIRPHTQGRGKGL